MKFHGRGLWLGSLALMVVGCAAQGTGGGTLTVGMTTDQAIEAMGQPDLKDNVPAPDHKGPDLLRYTWLSSGEAAVFGPNMRVANILNVGPSPTTLSAASQPIHPDPPFDPIQTPFDYISYPLRAAVVYIFAGLNCLGGNGCHTPPPPPVVPG